MSKTAQMSSPVTTMSPFAGCLRDVAMVDQDCLRMFDVLGRLRSPFQGVDNWPDLDDAFAEYSAAWLGQYGEEAWKTAGGEHDLHGRPTCRRTSELAVRALDRIVREHGGLKWMDIHNGKEWAVRLERATNGDPKSLYGFAISWFGGRIPLDPATRQRFESVDEAIGRRLRLYRRAEQLLWITYATVMQQRTSLIKLPDIALGQALWGGDRAKWPKDWRSEILQAFSALTNLHLEKLRLSANGWRPQLCAVSVAIAHAELLALDRENPGRDQCQPPCPLYGSLHAPQHHHFLVQAGYGLLGKLESFAIPAVDTEKDGSPKAVEIADVRTANNTLEHTRTRCYDDFGGEPSDEQRAQTFRNARKAGQIVPVHLLTRVFGSATWSELQPNERCVLQALIQEVTRDNDKKARSGRPDRAHIQIGNRVPGFAPDDSYLVCPYLEDGGRYVAFGGNGVRRGMGYLVFGTAGKGWLAKCGYAPPKGSSPHCVRRSAKAFLAAFAHLCHIAGLIVVGLYRPTKPEPPVWLKLDQLRQLAKSSKGGQMLEKVHLRVYGPEDYLDRLRAYYATQGNMARIPGAAAESTTSPRSSGDVAQTLLCCGLSQRQIAHELGCSQPYLNQCVHGKRPWPDRVKPKLERLLSRLAVLTS